MAAWKTPVAPAKKNVEMNAMAYFIGTLRLILPPIIVPNQLNTLMPDGTAIANVIAMNGNLPVMVRPDVNMW